MFEPHDFSLRGAALLGVALLSLSACQIGSPERTSRSANQPAARTVADPTLGASPVVQSRSIPARPSTRPVSPAASGPDVGTLLRTATISGVTWEDESYDEVFKLVRAVADVAVIVTPAAREVIDGEGLTMSMELVAPLAVRNLLNLMVGKSDDLAWSVRYGVVQISTEAEGGDGALLCTYDVRDLVFARTEFIPPVIRGIPTGDEETPRTGYEGEDRVSFIEPDVLIANIKDATDPTYWDAEGGGTIDYADGGYLIVKASPEMHRRLGRCLGR